MSLKGMAKETLSIVEAGSYAAPSGRTVSVRSEVLRAVQSTALFRPEQLESLLGELAPRPSAPPPRIEVSSETTAVAARRLLEAEGCEHVVALNFASAKNPGGGFLGGAKAQEEDLARCSALYTCQLRQPHYYATHRASHSMLYSDHMIYSPDVPFFRDDTGALLEAPFLLSVITSAAPNAGEVVRHGGHESALVVPTLLGRARKVLALAASRGHRCLVLGAWGCGVFRNDPSQVAEAFAQLLEPAFAGAFERVVFAVYERGDERPNQRAFTRRFG